MKKNVHSLSFKEGEMDDETQDGGNSISFWKSRSALVYQQISVDGDYSLIRNTSP